MSNNIVLITIDSLRADHCGFLDGDQDLTPTLDTFAEDGLVFEQAVAPGPRTPSSMPAIFTGEFFRSDELGLYDNYDEKSHRWKERRARIRRHLDRFRTLPEHLRERGYDTAGVTANPWTTSATNFDQGFNIFHAVQERNDITADSLPVASAVGTLLNSGLDEWLITWPDFYELVAEARADLVEPYFLWVFLLDPHQPYLAPRRYRMENSALGMYYSNIQYNRAYSYTDRLPAHLATRLERAYRDTVRSVDAFVDRVRTELADDEPAFVVHADHGEAFGDHGTYGHRPQLYRENLHVPLVAHNVGTTGRVQTPVGLRQLPELVVELADDGELTSPEAFTRPFVLAKTEEEERVAVRAEQWSYIKADSRFENYLHQFQAEELYDLARDPTESKNIVDGKSDRTQLMRSILRGHREHQAECATIRQAAAESVNDVV